MLLSGNPLAAEQLRRIIAERNRTELQAEIDAFKASSNSVGTEVDVANNSSELKTMVQVAE
jgi:chromosome segregation and condensation protein ScpB